MPIPVPRKAMTELRELFSEYTQDPRSRFRRAFGRTASNDDVSAPIKDFLMVGGMLDEYGLPLLRDVELLGASLQGLAKVGAKIDPDFNASIVNIDAEQGGEDFLSPRFKAKADVVLSCFIYNRIYNREPDCTHTNSVYANSPQHNRPGIWHDKALETGARAVIVAGDSAGAKYRSPREAGGEVSREFYLKEDGKLDHVLHGLLNGGSIGVDMLLRDDFKKHLETQNGRPFDPPYIPPPSKLSREDVATLAFIEDLLLSGGVPGIGTGLRDSPGIELLGGKSGGMLLPNGILLVIGGPSPMPRGSDASRSFENDFLGVVPSSSDESGRRNDAPGPVPGGNRRRRG
jgi:hypothetical protein